MLLDDRFPGLDNEKSRQGHGNAFPLPSPRAFQGEEGEESWSSDAAGYWRRRHLAPNPLPQLLDTSSPALTSSPKGFAALLLLLQAAFVFPGIAGRAVLLQMVTHSAISGHQLDWTSPARGRGKN